MPNRIPVTKDSGHHRNGKRQQHHLPVHMDVGFMRDRILRHQAHNRRNAAIRQQHAQEPAGKREHYRLRQELTEDAARRGPERNSNGDLALPRRGPRQQQNGYVRAADDQKQTNRCHQNFQGSAETLEQKIVQGLDPHAEARLWIVVRAARGEPLGNGL